MSLDKIVDDRIANLSGCCGCPNDCHRPWLHQLGNWIIFHQFILLSIFTLDMCVAIVANKDASSHFIWFESLKIKLDLLTESKLTALAQNELLKS
jgi:hypothetical protein